ncbi:MAG TPA: SDR family NAD(P)-dependent oxidoreductase [Pirellulales bacterium]|nr:SDR family NAD(P)-dependent oxidoreductase [Pirellulales bacterium]
MNAKIDKLQFGPWALITGASSGIGREFARQIAASGIHVVLVARREALLEEVGRGVAAEFGVKYRTVVADLSQDGFLKQLAEATDELDLGLIVSNAGTGNPGKFLSIDRRELENLLRLNTMSHLDIAHHFGQKLARRGKGGLLFVGAMAALLANPYMANDVAAKAYVLMLGESLHYDFRKMGLNVTVVMPGATDTPVLAKFGFDAATTPMKPMLVHQCVAEGLAALSANRARCVPGRMNRIMLKLMPRPILRKMLAKKFEQVVANKSPAL